MAACFQWALVTEELRNGSRAMPSAPSPPSPASIDREALPPTRLQPFQAPIVLSESSIRTPSAVFGSGSVMVSDLDGNRCAQAAATYGATLAAPEEIHAQHVRFPD
jgi:hypothetical protein